MAKDPLTSHRPERPVPYWFVVRWLDRAAGRTDGKRGLLGAYLTTDDRHADAIKPGTAIAPTSAVTPYLGAINQRFRSQAERARNLAEADTAATRVELEAVRRRAVLADERLAAARKDLERVGDAAPPEVLQRRSMLETQAGAPDALVRTRNEREWHAAVRGPLLRAEREAAAALHQLREQEADAVGVITVRFRIAASRVRRLHEHALRRHRTYERQLLLRHRGGAELLRQLATERPTLPEWAVRVEDEAGHL